MGNYYFEIDPYMEKYLRRKKRIEKAVNIFWICFAALAVISVVFSIGTDAYRSAKPFDGTYMKWEETWYSDAIKYVGYDMYHDKLAVVFNSSDNVYIYSGVKGDVAKQLQSADSIGSYYNENIKGKFPSEKIPDSESFIAKSIFQIQ